METHSLLTREIFGNVSSFSKALFYGLSFVALAALAWGIVRRVRLWQLGKRGTDPIDWRAVPSNLWKFVLLQRRVRGRGAASTAHILLFGGFLVLSIGTALIAVEHVLASLLGRTAEEPVFHKGLYFAIYEVILDAGGLALLAGCAFFAYRRWKRPPEIGHNWRDWVVLASLGILGVTGYVLEGLRIVREQTPMPELSFVGVLFAKAYQAAGMTPSSAGGWHITVWWFHAVLALAFTALFPYVRLLHAIAGTVRLASGVERPGALSPVSLQEFEESGEIGVSRVEQFNRRQLLELDACVSCGRCEQACPAFEAGKPLSPRDVVQDIRAHFEGVTVRPILAAPRRMDADTPPSLIGDVIQSETLWACTTCSACVDVCPLGVSPLGFIVDMRRSLVAEGQLRGSPAQALQKTDRTGNPWGMPAQDRIAWAAGLRVPTIQENPNAEVLYWVGCAAAYDRRLQKVARSMVKLLQAANVNFAVLGNLERCTGETARRMGDELLFQQLASKNIETFEKFAVRKGAKRIVSHCPHCVNSFLRDYSQLGAKLDVVHHTQFLDELVQSGRLKMPSAHAPAEPASVTYHDPCYLARAQDVTATPRSLLSLARGSSSLVEMPRHGRQASCCGAGGGRMWFDDAPDRRVGQSRITEAMATGARTLAVSCPFCLTMTNDGLAARDGGMAVRDIAEIMAEALPQEPEKTSTIQSTHGL